MNQKGISSTIIILIIVGVLIIAGGIWAWQNQKEKSVACTQDTKLCPDGSSVGRTGPNCEFAACPKLKLTSDILKNTQYYSPYLKMSIKLTNGVYPSGEQAEGMIDSFTSLDENHIAFSDLNNDGQEEAVVILITRDVGPVGMTSELAVVVNQNGNPFNIATQGLGKTEIHSLKIASGIISVDMTPWIISGDRVLGPGTRITVNYKLSGNKLLEF